MKTELILEREFDQTVEIEELCAQYLQWKQDMEFLSNERKMKGV